MDARIKITIELPDPLFAQAQHYAATNNMTLSAMIEQGLREILAEEKGIKCGDHSQ
jgi:predicted transcriptional regulator